MCGAAADADADADADATGQEDFEAFLSKVTDRYGLRGVLLEQEGEKQSDREEEHEDKAPQGERQLPAPPRTAAATAPASKSDGSTRGGSGRIASDGETAPPPPSSQVRLRLNERAQEAAAAEAAAELAPRTTAGLSVASRLRRAEQAAAAAERERRAGADRAERAGRALVAERQRHAREAAALSRALAEAEARAGAGRIARRRVGADAAAAAAAAAADLADLRRAVGEMRSWPSHGAGELVAGAKEAKEPDRAPPSPPPPPPPLQTPAPPPPPPRASPPPPRASPPPPLLPVHREARRAAELARALAEERAEASAALRDAHGRLAAALQELERERADSACLRAELAARPSPRALEACQRDKEGLERAMAAAGVAAAAAAAAAAATEASSLPLPQSSASALYAAQLAAMPEEGGDQEGQRRRRLRCGVSGGSTPVRDRALAALGLAPGTLAAAPRSALCAALEDASLLLGVSRPLQGGLSAALRSLVGVARAADRLGDFCGQVCAVVFCEGGGGDVGGAGPAILERPARVPAILRDWRARLAHAKACERALASIAEAAGVPCAASSGLAAGKGAKSPLAPMALAEAVRSRLAEGDAAELKAASWREADAALAADPQVTLARVVMHARRLFCGGGGTAASAGKGDDWPQPGGGGGGGAETLIPALNRAYLRQAELANGLRSVASILSLGEGASVSAVVAAVGTWAVERRLGGARRRRRQRRERGEGVGVGVGGVSGKAGGEHNGAGSTLL